MKTETAIILGTCIVIGLFILYRWYKGAKDAPENESFDILNEDNDYTPDNTKGV